MIELPIVDELGPLSVHDAGRAGAERLLFTPNRIVNLGGYVMGLARRLASGRVTPVPNHLFWLGDRLAAPPVRVFIYTRAGEFRVAKVQGTDLPALVFYWGLEKTVFHDPAMTPVVFRLGGILTPVSSKLLPALSEWSADQASLSPPGQRTLAEIIAGSKIQAPTFGTFRRRRSGDTWHFMPTCSSWPVAEYEELPIRPITGELCNECLAKRSLALP